MLAISLSLQARKGFLSSYRDPRVSQNFVNFNQYFKTHHLTRQPFWTALFF